MADDVPLAPADDGPIGRRSPLERFGAWTRSLRPWQMVLLVFFGVMPPTAVLLAAWIALVIVLNHDPAHPVSAEAALNLMLVAILAGPGLVLMHRGQYRWFWHLQRARRSGRLKAGDKEPAYGSEPSAPPPRIAWSAGLRLRHALMYLVGMVLLVATFAPYGHQVSILHWLVRFSAGPASRGSLSGLVFVYLPLLLFSALAVALTYRQMERRDAGLLDAAQAIELDAELNWLFSFAATFAVACLLCRFAGSAIIAYMD